MQVAARPEYGNWVSKRIIYAPLVVGVLFLVLAVLHPVLVILAGISFLACAYFVYARFRLSPRGGNVQDLILELVLRHLDWNGEGRALDIGCGNGALAIKVARKFPGARVVGIDYWGSGWEYSKDACEKNAKTEGVGDRVVFEKASASALPFGDEYFDAVVSNLVFHEVRDSADKKALIREALRVVTKGGKFTFQDLFLMKRVYGSADDLVGIVRSWGTSKVEFIPTRNAPSIPLLLKLPFMVGTMGILVGEK